MNWQRFISNNIGWKLGSLFLAMMIWSSYYSNETGLDLGDKLFENSASKYFIGFHIQLLSQQNKLQSVGLSPEDVTISLSGPRETITPLTKNDILAYIDISNIVPGSTNQLPVQIKVPRGVVVDHVFPSNITVRVTAPSATP